MSHDGQILGPIDYITPLSAFRLIVFLRASRSAVSLILWAGMMPFLAQCQSQTAPSALAYAESAHKALAENKLGIAERDLLRAKAASEVALGNIALANGEPAEAIALYDQAAPIIGSTRQVLLSKAMALAQTGKPDDAILDLRRFLRNNPSDLNGRRLLGEVLATKGEMHGALSEFVSILLRFPDDPETLYMAGAASLKLGNAANARGYFTKLSSKVPGAATEILIGRTYRDLHFDRESAIHLRKALSLDPHIQRAHFYLATLDIMREGSVNLQEAESEFEQELALYPYDYLSNLYLGIVFEQEHLPARAQPYLLHATELKPSSPDGYVYLAACYFEQEKYLAASEAALLAISLTPDPSVDDYRIANTHYILAQALRRMGNAGEADREVKIAQKLKQQANTASRLDLKEYLSQAKNHSEDSYSVRWVSPRMSQDASNTSQEQEQYLRRILLDAQFNLGNLYLREGKAQAAQDSLEFVFEKSPQFPGILELYGASLFLLSKYDSAIPILRKALETAPNNTETRRFLGQAYCKKEDYANAAATLRGEHWRDIPTQYALAISLARSGDDAAAANAFSTLLEEHPHSAEIEDLLGQAASEQKRYALAISHFRNALEIDPKVPEAHLGLGLIDMRNGNLEAATQEFRGELAAHSEDLRTEFYLAYILGLRQNHVEAIRIFRKIINQRPDFPDAHAALGAELLTQNQLREALAEFLAADKLNPEQPKLQYQIGTAYRRLGQTDLAEKSFAHFRALQKLDAERHPAGGMGGPDIR